MGTERKRLCDLKVGDRVLVHGRWDTDKTVAVVQKVHKRHLVVRGQKYRKSDGNEAGAGDSYPAFSISVASDLEIEQVLRDRHRRHVLNEVLGFNRWRLATVEELEAVAGVVREVSRRGVVTKGGER